MPALRFELIIGCMFAGKSNELVRRAKRLEAVGSKVLMVNHDHDTRTCKSVKTHDGVKVSAVKVSSLMSLIGTSFLQEADAICIDEGQFFADIGEFITSLELYSALMGRSKTIVVSSLDGDMNRKPWRNITDLVCLADSVTKVSALERLPDGEIVEANFSMLISDKEKHESNEVKIGAAETYKAVSRQTYIAEMLKRTTP